MRSFFLNILFAASIIFLVGCGDGFQVIESSFIDPEIQEYVDRYLEYKEEYLGVRHIKTMDIYFKSLREPYIGFCTVYGNGSREISIDPDFWFNTTDADREVLILHEMGHCDMGYDHHENSIMEEYHIGGRNYTRNKEHYLEEFFLLQ